MIKKKNRFGNNNGQTIIELMTELPMTLMAILVMTAVLVYALNRFSVIMDQLDAQQSLIQATYFTKRFLGQAVSTQCYAGPPIPTPYNMTIPAVGAHPQGVAAGVVDCRDETVMTWPLNTQTPLALFMREDGQGSTATLPQSKFLATGIYFEPPTGTSSGLLYFASGNAGGTLQPTTSGIVINKLVNVGIIPGSVTTASGGALQTLTIHFTARYYTTPFANAKTYIPGDANNGYRDIDTSVTVRLRNNWLGYSFVGGTTSERLDGHLYYYMIQTPTLGNF